MNASSVANKIDVPAHLNAAASPCAVIVGLDSLQGLQAARILAKRKVPVIGMSDDPKHPGCRTNVCGHIIHAETVSNELISALELLGPKLKQKAVLFPCEDANVLLVSRHRERLEKWYHIVLPPPQVVEMLMDKISFYAFAQENGLPIPPTHFVDSEAELQRVLSKLQFPCVLKPRDSAAPRWEQDSMFSPVLWRNKAFKLSNAEDLKATYDHYSRWTDCFVVQEWIEGSDADLYSCNCYFGVNGQPLVTFVARKLRQWPPHTGCSCIGEECRNDTVLQEALRLFRSLDYQGLGYLEMKRDARTGEHLIVEPNVGRPTGRSAIAEAGGVELLYTMYCDAIGWPLPNNRAQKYDGTKWIHLRRDLQSSFYYWRRGELTLYEWWRSWRGKKAFALFSWKDPAPFFADWSAAIRAYMSPAERKRRSFRDFPQRHGETT